MFTLALPVAIGGAIGTAARAQAELVFIVPDGRWPWTTFVVNVVGSLLLGALLECLLRSGEDLGWHRVVRLGCGTGLLGGFTTYSTFIIEVDQLARGEHVALAVLYPLVSVVAGLGAAGIGVAVTAAVHRARSQGHR